MRSFDAARSGANTAETILTPAAVRTRGVMRGVLSSVRSEASALIETARSIPSMTGLDLASLSRDLSDAEADSIPLARELFGTWLEHVVGLTRRLAA